MNIQDNINEVIASLEEERNIQVLYACESGSRAWGFESPDSDYDLRFIYAHPQSWYLGLQKQRDVIDLMLPNDLDLSGWDLAKTLRLFSTCSLALNEWLDSPICYWQRNGFREELVNLIPSFFNSRKAVHHYLSMAKGTAKDNFDGPRIKIKKLFYILRPLFACYWIEANNSMPPTIFQSMLNENLANRSLLEIIAEIQKQKEIAVEAEVIETPIKLVDWIQSSIIYFEETEPNFPSGENPGWEGLNTILKNWTKT